MNEELMQLSEQLEREYDSGAWGPACQQILELLHSDVVEGEGSLSASSLFSSSAPAQADEFEDLLNVPSTLMPLLKALVNDTGEIDRIMRATVYEAMSMCSEGNYMASNAQSSRHVHDAFRPVADVDLWPRDAQSSNNVPLFSPVAFTQVADADHMPVDTESLYHLAAAFLQPAPTGVAVPGTTAAPGSFAVQARPVAGQPLPRRQLEAQSKASSRGLAAPLPVGLVGNSDARLNESRDEAVPSPQQRSMELDANVLTLYVRNVPARYTPHNLMEFWPPKDSYYLLYMPYSHERRRTSGCVLINFISHDAAAAFKREWDGRPLMPELGARRLEVTIARVQGFEHNLWNLRCSKKIMRTRNARYMPCVIMSDGTIADFRRFAGQMQPPAGLNDVSDAGSDL
jgi:hypothetical protein